MRVICPIRTQDKWGAGHYLASRGNRNHHGIDFACYPGTTVLNQVNGTVTKLGYVYGDDLSYRYVEVTDEHGHQFRYFYVEPEVREGQFCMEGHKLGVTQSLDKRYPGITEHCHLGVKKDGAYLDPSKYV